MSFHHGNRDLLIAASLPGSVQSHSGRRERSGEALQGVRTAGEEFVEFPRRTDGIRTLKSLKTFNPLAHHCRIQGYLTDVPLRTPRPAPDPRRELEQEDVRNTGCKQRGDRGAARGAPAARPLHPAGRDRRLRRRQGPAAAAALGGGCGRAGGPRPVGGGRPQRLAPAGQAGAPEVTLANIYASMGIDELERRFPVLSQTADEVMGHLTDALFLTLDDLQMRVTDDIGAAAESATWLLEGTREAVVTQLDSVRRSALGGAVASGLDELLSRSEEAALFYLPLNERWSQELELRMQMFEDDDEEEEPAVLTRVVGLLLRVGLRSYQQALLLWDQVQHAVSTLRDLADLIGLTLVAEAVSGLAQMLLTLYVAGIYRLQSLQTLARRRASELALRLAALRPVSLALSLPERARASLAVVVTDLQELGKILVQLLINTTPLYNMLKEQADQLGANRLSLEELSDGGSSRRGSCDLVLSKASEGRLARRRRQAYLEARSRRGSKQDRPPPAQPEQEPIPAAPPRRRSSSTEVFLAPIIQLVSQGQRAFEYLSPGPAPVPPAVEVANQVAETAE